MGDDKLVLTPSDFVALSNQTLEFAMPFISIEGELSELRVSKGKWLYFKLKDEHSVVSCFGVAHMLPGPMEDGMVLRVSGSPRLHPRFGFSFNAASISLSGQGTINKAYELLKKKLTSEGLFEDSRKRTIEVPPSKIAIVTSAEGAAIGDFTKILAQRWPYAAVDIYDSLVQGDNAPDSLLAAIDRANQSDYDVLVVTRGGGGAEDLAAFNDERVVRAVVGSRTPTVVAIGHEQDESLCELAADMRASTPSNAAELISLERSSEIQRLSADKQFFTTALQRQVQSIEERIKDHKDRLSWAVDSVIRRQDEQLDWFRRSLNLVNPTNVLAKGYAIVSRQDTVIKSKKSVDAGQTVRIRLADGSINAEVVD